MAGKTDNSFFEEKVKLRCVGVEGILADKQTVSVLDCYAGTGKIWDAVARRYPDAIFNIVRIDKNPRRKGTLKGDNVKFLKTLDLSQFDIIDLDAYGIPFEQMEVVFNRAYSGIIIFTAIARGKFKLNLLLLERLGYPIEMVKKIHTLFSLNPIDKFVDYLAISGVEKMKFFEHYRVLYGMFCLNCRRP